MAKVGKLAGLAALGALAYMNRDKLGMGKETEGPAATAAEKEASDARAKAQKNAISGNSSASSMSDEAKAEMKRETQRGSIGSIPSKPKSTSLAKPSVESGKANLRDAEAGKSRGSRPSTSTSSSSEEGMRSYSTRSGSLAGSGRGSVNPSMVTPSSPRDSEASMSRGTRPPVIGGGRGTINPKSVTPQQSSRDMESGMSRGRREMTSGPGQSQIDNIRKLQSSAGVPSSMAGRPGFDETGRRMPSMAGREGYDEAGNPMKRGGMVKKMASGGMTASRRADGIATKGKTRGKIC